MQELVHVHHNDGYISGKMRRKKPYVKQADALYKEAKYIEMKTSQLYGCLLVSMFQIATCLLQKESLTTSAFGTW